MKIVEEITDAKYLLWCDPQFSLTLSKEKNCSYNILISFGKGTVNRIYNYTQKYKTTFSETPT